MAAKCKICNRWSCHFMGCKYLLEICVNQSDTTASRTHAQRVFYGCMKRSNHESVKLQTEQRTRSVTALCCTPVWVAGCPLRCAFHAHSLPSEACVLPSAVALCTMSWPFAVHLLAVLLAFCTMPIGATDCSLPHAGWGHELPLSIMPRGGTDCPLHHANWKL